MSATAPITIDAGLLAYGPLLAVRADGTKRPDGRRCPRGVYSATRDETMLASWGAGPRGIATGHKMTDGRYLYILDRDPRNGGDETIRGMALPATAETRTQSGGAHYYFGSHEPLPSVSLGPGVDGLGVGKYACVYEWELGCDPDMTPIADLPEAIVSQIRRSAPTTAGNVVVEGSGLDTVIGQCCAAAGLVRATRADGSAIIVCPLASEHSDGRGGGDDDSCILLPRVEGSALGAISCKHSHGATLAGRRALDHFAPHVVAAAEARYPRTAAPLVIAPEAALSTIDDVRQRLAYITTKGGHKVEKISRNITTILTHDPRWVGVLAFDEFSQVIRFVGEPPWHPDDRTALPSRVWTDSDVHRMCNWLQREWALDMPPAKVQAAVVAAAEANAVNPVTEWLGRLQWDGVMRLDRWLDHLGVEHTPYSRAVGAKWLISAVARAYQPGCKVDTLMVLEGKQGRGKSSALATLCPYPEWFSDTPIPIGQKDSYLALHGKLIIELAELASLSKAEVEKVKAFFSSQSDYYRPPYGRSNVDVPRRCVFAGTTNSDEYLKDATGGRRYFPVRTGIVDLDGLRADRDQLWAEARDRYKAGETWWPSYDETPMFEAEQADREEVDPWTRAVASWVESEAARNLIASRGYITTDEVLTMALGVDLATVDKPKQTRIGVILTRSLRWQRRQRRIGAARVWGYGPE